MLGESRRRAVCSSVVMTVASRIGVTCVIGATVAACGADSLQAHDVGLGDGGYALVRVGVWDSTSADVTFRIAGVPPESRHLLYFDVQSPSREAEGGRSVGWFDGTRDLVRASRCHLESDRCNQPGVGRLVAVGAPDAAGEARLHHAWRCPPSGNDVPCVFYYSIVAVPRDAVRRTARLEIAMNSGEYVGETPAQVTQIQ